MSRIGKGLGGADLVRQAKLLQQDGHLDSVGCSGSVFEYDVNNRPQYSFQHPGGVGLTEVDISFASGHFEMLFDFLESCGHSLELLKLSQSFPSF